ncbi:uncharacterized protein LOC130939349 [Arachis stenosperma]|uniref:uncharacterized protein LOC130939349 n=1 Tax=Arachis stenosperma TaxID=217475 RepID=UPI0025ACFE04|nr:uncharacterized protein LOC130939349 [Arachis stenosperma]
MEGTANLVVYRDGEIIRNTHEGVRFVCQNLFSFVVPCIMTFMELQNGLSQSMENGTLMRVSRILYRNPVIVFGGLIQFDIMPITNEVTMYNMFQIHRQTQMRQPQIELYVEFETVKAEGIQNDLAVEDDRAAVYEGMNSDSKDDFEATYEAGDEDENGDVAVETAADNVVVHPSISQPMNVPPFMRELDLDAMHASEFPEYSNIGVADPKDGEFWIGMEYSSRKSVVAIIRSYTIARGVDYDVYESEPQTFYAKCKMYGRGCDWLIRACSIRKKGCWKIRRYNGRHTCTTRVISQDHSKLDSDTVVEAIRPLVETDPSIKVKTIIAEVQSRFNYTISYRKAWLTKQKSIAKVFGDWEESYQALPWWLSVMVQKMHGYTSGRCCIGWKPEHCAYRFCLVEGETADAWHFFLRNLRMHVVRKDGVGMISDRHESIRAAVNHSGGDWQPQKAWWMFCIRHIGSNFLRAFKVPHLQKFVVNIGYSRMVEEYNINYKRLEERGEAYARWCDAIGLRH